MSKRKDRLRLLGFGTLACVACCAGPVLAVLGSVTVLGIASSYFIGVIGIVIAATAAVAWLIVRRRRKNSCNLPMQPVSFSERPDIESP